MFVLNVHPRRSALLICVKKCNLYFDEILKKLMSSRINLARLVIVLSSLELLELKKLITI